ncbi:toprim domain-containing protein [Sphingomonas sp. Root50]|nr:toprim domain-containing protein [Sphingomonas sp. Root50]
MLNERARELAPDLLPNGVFDPPTGSPTHWKTSNMDDVKSGSYSLTVDLTGKYVGHWHDFGGARPGEEDGDMLDLIRIRRCGGNQVDAIGWAKDFLGITNGDRSSFERARRAIERDASAREAQHAAEIQKIRDGARNMWLHAAVLPGTPAELYLRGRSIDCRALGRAPGALRFRPDATNKEAGSKLPCMVAAIVGLDGAHLGTHRTWISQRPDGSWGKALLADPKLTLGASKGGFIPLWRGDGAGKLATIAPGTDIYVSEGIEDGLSVAMGMPDKRIIAAVSLSKVGSLQLPEQAGSIIIVGQNDPYGSKAVDALEREIGKLQARGFKVRIIYPPRTPIGGGGAPDPAAFNTAPAFKDFNEWLCKDPDGFFGRKAGRAVA